MNINSFESNLDNAFNIISRIMIFIAFLNFLTASNGNAINFE